MNTQERYEALPDFTKGAVDRVSEILRAEGMQSAQTFFDQLSHERKWKRWEAGALAELIRWKAAHAT